MRRILLFALVLCSPSFALQEFYSLSRSVRAMGMGGAFYSLSDDESALFYNPTGLGLQADKGFSFALRSGGMVSVPPQGAAAVLGAATSPGTLGGLSTGTAEFQGTPIGLGAQVGLFHNRKNFGITLFGDSKSNVLRTGSVSSPQMEVTQITDSGVVVGAAHRFGSHMYVGINAKVLYRLGSYQTFSSVAPSNTKSFSISGLDGSGSGLGVDADLGMTYQLPRLGRIHRTGFSLVISNLLANNFPWIRGEGAPPGLPLTINAGVYFMFKLKLLASPMVVRLEGTDYQTGGNADPNTGARVGAGLKFLRAGLELPFLDWLTVRTGLYHGTWTAGLSVDFSHFRADFATYSEELGGTLGEFPQRRLTLQLIFGLPGSGLAY